MDVSLCTVNLLGRAGRLVNKPSSLFFPLYGSHLQLAEIRSQREPEHL